jgi:hypothetical protein
MSERRDIADAAMPRQSNFRHPHLTKLQWESSDGQFDIVGMS